MCRLIKNHRMPKAFYKVVAQLLLVLIILAPAAFGQSIQWAWDGVPRIVAVGDVHGDYEQFAKLLADAELVDRKMNWRGGKTHLVQLGDVLDRGPYPRKISDLLMKLEAQAEKAGGRVHVLIGNHEAMNLYGDLRYTTREEYAEYRTNNSEQVRQAFFDQTVENLRRTQAENGRTAIVIDDVFRKQWEDEHPLGFFEQRHAYGPNGKYAGWILQHNAVIEINGSFFLHGGISPKYADMAPEKINQTIRAELATFRASSATVAADNEGPLWYRGLAEKDEQQLDDHLEGLLKRLNLRRIVIGHTPTLTTVIPRFGCRVILDDVGLVFGGPPACLVIENDTAYTLHRGKKLKIPCSGGAELLDYLRAAASLDPTPSPIEKTIHELQEKRQTGGPN